MGGLTAAVRRAAVAAALAVAVVLVLWAGAAAGSDAPAAAAPDAGDRAPAIAPPSRSGGAWVAKVLAPVPARRAPTAGSAVVRRLPSALAGGHHPVELLVLRRAVDAEGRGWLLVRLPTRPNDAGAWVPVDAVRLRHTRWRVEVSLRERAVRVLHAGRVRLTAQAVIGRPQTPTPTGLFALLFAARQADPGGFIGPWALHLSAHSTVLEDFGGGPGRVAIHGRAGASLADPLGSAASHGCIRVPNRAIEWMARTLRPGTPVVVR